MCNNTRKSNSHGLDFSGGKVQYTGCDFITPLEADQPKTPNLNSFIWNASTDTSQTLRSKELTAWVFVLRYACGTLKVKEKDECRSDNSVSTPKHCDSWDTHHVWDIWSSKQASYWCPALACLSSLSCFHVLAVVNKWKSPSLKGVWECDETCLCGNSLLVKIKKARNKGKVARNQIPEPSVCGTQDE